jgi:chorismate mutase/prephenate dehydratase
MGKRKASRSGSMPRSAQKKEDPIAELKQLERQIFSLLSSHARLAARLQSLASEEDLNDRIRARLDDLAERTKGPLRSGTLKRIAFELSSAESCLGQPDTIAYLGPQYSYSHLAAIQRFGHGAKLTPVASIATVFQDVHDQRASFGLVPLENSTDGRIVDTLGMFAKLPVRICGEVQLRIHHNLLAKGAAQSIRQIHSKPQALSQCREWLGQHFPNAQLVDAPSTTEAAQIASKDKSVGAIASRPAAAEYGLKIVASNIEDNPDNITRFALIGDEAAKRTKSDKTSLMLELSHRSGALADVMGIFKRNRLNLTWIESFPLPGRSQEYLFFIEFEGHQLAARAKRALTALGNRTVRLETLGSYPTSPPLD